MGKISRALDKSLEEGFASVTVDGSAGSGQPETTPEARERNELQPQRQPEAKVTKSSQWDERLLNVTGFSGELSESFRVLRSRILHPVGDEKEIRTILVTSAAPEEGKSFVSANLAIALARSLDQYCLVVDCDLRRPSVADHFGMSNTPGLSDYLQNKCDIPQVIQKTIVEKLTILASGAPPVNPSELLGSGFMQELVRELSSRYKDRYIIFDSPPFQVASETSVLAKQVDGVVIVVRWRASGREQIRKLVEDIGRDKIVGIVFNGYKSNVVESRLIKYSNYYNYEYASKYAKKKD